ncbi:Poly [ADP-ribose] polymerase 6 [Tritrichomonas musculus]|uniref:Poly [ADP-ribose] polymerase 6 n=1 Tax=Tritrichomonas musculus TaxID=1915356 RepID=A0ABR2H655_9EUKA
MHEISVDFNNFFFPVSISIPKSFLPVSLQVLYWFYINENALKIQFDHKSAESSFEITVTHPTLGEIFPGFSIIYDIVYKFTKQKLQIKNYYQSAPLVLYNKEVEPDL